MFKNNKTLKKIFNSILTSMSFFVAVSANAEYRVYQYYIKASAFKSQDKRSYIITSSFDPVTYRAYHGGQESVEIDLLRTWICPGHTGGLKVYCPSPYEGMKRLEELTKKENKS